MDFDALTAAAKSGHLKVATDVFPEEPFSKDHPIRDLPNVILSAHRSGGIQEALPKLEIWSSATLSCSCAACRL